MIPLRVEIHDRDPLDNELFARYERLVIGEEKLDPPGRIENTAAVEPASTATDEGDDEGEAGSPANQDANGLSPFEVDKIYLKEILEKWRTAGDEYSHGTATFRMNALLDQ